VYEGVVAGIADYGNKMGIPTVGGAMLFDPGYSANPLVFCGTVGLVPRGAHPTEPRPGDLIVLAGGRTGRDGIHGATFSSDVLDPSAGAELGSVVQIGDPIVEKRLADALPKARAERLYSAITDCGAGGLSSAVGEMARRLGAEVELSVVPLKYPGLRPWEIWLSEAQERMVLAVPPDRWPRLEAVFQAEGVEATVIGRFSGDGWLRVRYRGRTVVELDGRFLHEGMPVRELRSEWRPAPAEATLAVRSGPCAAGASLAAWLEAVLADPNVASKEPVVRRYDHEVQGRTVGKPFVGPALDGPADAAVLRPLPFGRRGLAIGCGINPRYGLIDPYAMALNAVDEALRNVVAVGADPDRTALLDNFCWGNPNLPDRLGGLVRAAQGCYAAAVGFRAPFISGKDSLNNEHRTPDGATRPIPGTLLVSALGIVPDLGRTVSMELKRAGDLVYLVGLTDDELGGSVYLKLQGRLGDRAPQVRPRRARRTLRALHRAIRAGLVRACHDLSEGGLGVAAAEMAFAGRLGLALDLRAVPTARPIEAADVLLFSESPSRFLVEVAPADAAAFERALAGCVVGRVGEVLAEPVLRALGRDGALALEADLERLRRAWQRPLGENGEVTE
jgi:phosphoribosylformylglycinamidine synthase